jgi:hypothetical protein
MLRLEGDVFFFGTAMVKDSRFHKGGTVGAASCDAVV